MKTLIDVTKCVAEYCNEYNLNDIEETGTLFEISKAYQTGEYYPQANKCGVYTVYGSKAELLYIGKASMNSAIGGRLFSHFPYAKGDHKKFEPIGGEEAWFGNPTYLYCFAVRNPWEASSLEEYMIYNLDPPANQKGRRKK